MNSYWRDQEQSHFDPEVELYRRFRADNQREMVSVFLYCGHEIPEVRRRRATMHRIRIGRSLFMTLPAGYKTSHVIPHGSISWCSPRVLAVHRTRSAHLDRLRDISSLLPTIFICRTSISIRWNGWISSLRDGDVPAFAKQFAQHAFDRLTGDIQTAVSVAVYDVDRAQGFRALSSRDV